MHHGFITASYTRSSSHDSAGTAPQPLPTPEIIAASTGDSLNQIPQTAFLALAYELPNLTPRSRISPLSANGWKPSAITILQSGTPFTVLHDSLLRPGRRLQRRWEQQRLLLNIPYLRLQHSHRPQLPVGTQ